MGLFCNWELTLPGEELPGTRDRAGPGGVRVSFSVDNEKQGCSLKGI